MSGKKQFSCPTCNQVFAHRQSVFKHKKKVHGGTVSSKNVKCREYMCSFSCRYLDDLRTHLNDAHRIEMMSVELEFATFSDFLVWKRSLETQTRSCYIKWRGDTTSIEGVKSIDYVCNRTGNFRSYAQGKRQPRRKGSCKIQGHCTAEIKVKQDSNSNVVAVTAHLTHYGHSIDVRHCRVSKTLPRDAYQPVEDEEQPIIIITEERFDNLRPLKEAGNVCDIIKDDCIKKLTAALDTLTNSRDIDRKTLETLRYHATAISILQL